MIDMVDIRAKRRFQVLVTRVSQNIETGFTNSLKRNLGALYEMIAREIENGTLNPEPTINGNNSKLQKIFRRYYLRVAETFGLMAFRSVFPKKTINSEFDKPITTEFWEAINLWIETEAVNEVVIVGKTIKKAIKKIVAKGISEEISHKEIAKKIRERKKTITRAQSLRIARTETHNMATRSMHAAMKASRLTLREKGWISAKDSRTRRRGGKQIFDHWVADGERVGIDDYFVKTGEDLRYPGDSLGSAGNIINCRCVQEYFTRIFEKSIRRINKKAA